MKPHPVLVDSSQGSEYVTYSRIIVQISFSLEENF